MLMSVCGWAPLLSLKPHFFLQVVLFLIFQCTQLASGSWHPLASVQSIFTTVTRLPPPLCLALNPVISKILHYPHEGPTSPTCPFLCPSCLPDTVLVTLWQVKMVYIVP